MIADGERAARATRHAEPAAQRRVARQRVYGRVPDIVGRKDRAAAQRRRWGRSGDQVDGAAKGSGLKVVRVDDYWKASQLEAAVLPWDANVFQERDGRLVSFGDSRPSFTATISRDGDTLTVRTPDGVYHYTRD